MTVIYCLFVTSKEHEDAELLTWWSNKPTVQEISAILDLQIHANGNIVDTDKTNIQDLFFTLVLLDTSTAGFKNKVYRLKQIKEGEKK